MATAIKTKTSGATKKKLYSVEEVFDRIDNKFINFYGEYGKKIVNDRRKEWNRDNTDHFKTL